MPQLSVLPQPSAILPQVLPWAEQVVGTQPQILDVPLPPQVWGLTHVPQLSVPPQPSETLPQVRARAEQVVGVQAPGAPGTPRPLPQTLEVPLPPQVWGLGHEPQLRAPPQPMKETPPRSTPTSPSPQ